ncbi:heavy-metal-associated domain-containing protein [Sphingomonas sabuli]|uniref:Heavy-metal-associated domain-containing protein n=1 Tax=Sphingomonas sabuli TaxID=2764186 RepID=A0A7G9L4R0_9SPHN|nr:heavy-metal-associated domain-containing protein [Sphingomonas sabuli]QNM83609.1 heavy-metal-associated domain-containing protein [Sphingomonas sabuli]
MARRPIFLAAILALLGIVAAGGVYAQMEATERGIPPLDSSGTLEIGGLHVDVGGKTPQESRYAGWRVAQRLGFKKLWAKSHKLPESQAPNLSDATLDTIVSSIIVEREQIGPNRYIADLGILFDRARAGELLGIGGQTRRSQPMLLIPVTITGGSATSLELRNPWQRAWAQFRTSQSAIDYVRVSGQGVDPLLINAAQARRPGRGWWRNILDLYGAADILVAEVNVHRLYPGGPARARFIARHGPDGEIVGGFELTAPNSAAIPQMMERGVQQMDALFTTAYDAGALARDSSLNLPEPPPPPLEEEVAEKKAKAAPTTYRIGVTAPNAATYNSAFAHLRAVPGVARVDQLNIALGDTSYFNVSYRGDVGRLVAILTSRGWGAEVSGGQVRLFVRRPEPPAEQRPAQPQPQPTQPQAPANQTEPSAALRVPATGSSERAELG